MYLKKTVGYSVFRHNFLMNMFITPEFNHQCACVLFIYCMCLTDFLHYFANITFKDLDRDNFTGGHSMFPCFQNIFSYIFASI